MKGIYKFNFDCGRSGSLEGTFIEDSENVKILTSHEDIEVYFGEVLGKHSEVYGNIEETDIKLVSTDEQAIKIIEDLNILPSGYSPFDYTASSHTQVEFGMPDDCYVSDVVEKIKSGFVPKEE